MVTNFEIFEIFDYELFKRKNRNNSFMKNRIKQPAKIAEPKIQHSKTLNDVDKMVYRRRDRTFYPVHNTFNDYEQEAFKLAQRMFGFSRNVFFSDNDTIMTFEVNEKDYALNYNDPFLFNYSVGIQNKKEYKIELSFNDKYIKEYRVDGIKETKYFIELKTKNLYDNKI